MKFIRFSCVGLAIVLGYIAIVACGVPQVCVPTHETEIVDNGVDENCDGIIEGTRFSDMGDGTVRDEDSGLIWLKDAICLELAGTDWYGKAQWATANNVAAASLASGTCGLTDESIAGDWRLPTKDEWEAFVDLDYEKPALCNSAGTDAWEEGDAFYGTIDVWYWSSSENGGEAWAMHTDKGDIINVVQSKVINVWPVRSAN
jgi:hypothetical protein